MKVNRRVRKKTFQHIEQELFFYDETKKDIEMIRNEILHGTRQVDNPDGGKSNLPGDPTGSKAVQLSSDELGGMERVIEAIEKVYQLSDKRTQEFIKLFYFAKPRTLTIEGVAQKLYVSRRNVFYIRHNIVRRLAVELGWW